MKISSLSLTPTIAILQVGARAESEAYVAQKKKCAERIGARVIHIRFSEDSASSEIETAINSYNTDDEVHGIILQLPLPPHLDQRALAANIDPCKDVDGLAPANIAALVGGGVGHVPATARGIRTLLAHYNILTSGKKVVVVGRSLLVGKPTALLLLRDNATVTICHRTTQNLAEVTRGADILVVAAGVPGLITREHVRAGQVVIDVGVNMQADAPADALRSERFTGDVDFSAVSEIVAAISPVPGGVGPMTVVSLFQNLIDAYERITRENSPREDRESSARG